MELNGFVPIASDPGRYLPSALHELGISVLVVGLDLGLCYANRAGKAELAGGRTLQERDGSVRGLTEAQDDALIKAMQAARQGRRSLVELGLGSATRMHAVIPIGATETAPPAVLICAGARHPFGDLALTLFARASGLTSSERDVLMALCGGLAAREIAAERDVSLATVRTQISSIREKMGASSVTQVIRKVYMLPPLSVRELVGRSA